MENPSEIQSRPRYAAVAFWLSLLLFVLFNVGAALATLISYGTNPTCELHEFWYLGGPLLAGATLFALFSIKRSFVESPGGSIWMVLSVLALGSYLFLTYNIAMGFWSTYKTCREVKAFCAEKGALRSNQSFQAHGIRFTPNLCYYDFGTTDLCAIASNPTKSASELLVKGFDFVEIDIGPHQISVLPESSFKLVRLFLSARPNKKCGWIDRKISHDIERAKSALARYGIPTNQCIAAEFDAPSESEYQIVLTTSELTEHLRGKRFRANLIETRDGKSVAEMSNIYTKSTPGCRNEGRFVALLNMVVPAKSSTR